MLAVLISLVGLDARFDFVDFDDFTEHVLQFGFTGRPVVVLPIDNSEFTVVVRIGTNDDRFRHATQMLNLQNEFLELGLGH